MWRTSLPPDYFVNVGEMSSIGEMFVDLPPGVERRDINARPINALERMVTKPKVARYRAAVSAVVTANGRPIISHLPRVSAAVGLAGSLLRSRSPHMAFSFNFTRLPTGVTRRYMQRVFAGIEQFCVFSEFERGLYADYFRLPADRFRRLLWTQDVPPVAVTAGPFAVNSYVCAIGGEGRDYAALIEAARRLPQVPFVIVGRSYTVLADPPRNVTFFADLPLGQTWRLAADSSCLVVPLLSSTTCCGHITLVSGKLLGLPVISTRSEATAEYTQNVALCEPGSAADLAQLIEMHHLNAVSLKASARERAPLERERHSRDHWRNAVAEFLLESR